MEQEIAEEPVNTFKGNPIKYDAERGQKVQQRESFSVTRRTVLLKLQDNLQSRFPRVDLLDAMQVANLQLNIT